MPIKKTKQTCSNCKFGCFLMFVCGWRRVGSKPAVTERHQHHLVPCGRCLLLPTWGLHAASRRDTAWPESSSAKGRAEMAELQKLGSKSLQPPRWLPLECPLCRTLCPCSLFPSKSATSKHPMPLAGTVLGPALSHGHEHPMATDIPQPWTSHNHGHPVDMDIPWTWTSHNHGHPMAMDILQPQEPAAMDFP